MANNCYSEFAFYCEPNEIEKLQSFQNFINKNIGYISKVFESLDIPPEFYEQKTESLR